MINKLQVKRAQICLISTLIGSWELENMSFLCGDPMRVLEILELLKFKTFENKVLFLK